MTRSISLTIAVALVLHAMRDGNRVQHTWESDVSVRALELSVARPGDSITARVTVTTDRGAARAVRLEIILPVGVGMLAIPPGCRSSPAPVMSLAARVTCALGDLHANALRDVSITTTGRPGARLPLRFAAFAFSDTPDPLPGNNFVERDAP
jgi:hypothetical protein